jgi:hypothetical protein
VEFFHSATSGFLLPGVVQLALSWHPMQAVDSCRVLVLPEAVVPPPPPQPASSIARLLTMSAYAYDFVIITSSLLNPKVMRSVSA